VGNADPGALQVAVAALEAFRFVGLPEGVLPMSEAAIYLATAPSRTLLRATPARKDVMERGALPSAPRPQRATRLMKEMGYGSGYKYRTTSTGTT